MKHISVTDTTIRQAGKAAGYTLSFREKIELAKLLDRLGVSVIELHAVENPKIDSLLIKSVASAVKESAVCVPVWAAARQASAAPALWRFWRGSWAWTRVKSQNPAAAPKSSSERTRTRCERGLRYE